MTWRKDSSTLATYHCILNSAHFKIMFEGAVIGIMIFVASEFHIFSKVLS